LTPTTQFHYQLFIKTTIKKYLTEAGFRDIKFITDKPRLDKIEVHGNSIIKFLKKSAYMSVCFTKITLKYIFPSRFKHNILVMTNN